MGRKTSPGPRKSSSKEAATKTASRSFKIKNELGLHARAAALFVKTASKFKAEISIKKGAHEVNGKSIMGLLMLAAGHGTEIQLAANGPDAPRALQELGGLIENRFGEK
ncbi:MAG: HPr family phosphocarrier protein [Deltaproteobacteria bacterium]|nr:HPr family phosphocarrier protein [Deltaproteobacteria bacterium]